MYLAPVYHNSYIAEYPYGKKRIYLVEKIYCRRRLQRWQAKQKSYTFPPTCQTEYMFSSIITSIRLFFSFCLLFLLLYVKIYWRFPSFKFSNFTTYLFIQNWCVHFFKAKSKLHFETFFILYFNFNARSIFRYHIWRRIDHLQKWWWYRTWRYDFYWLNFTLSSI